MDEVYRKAAEVNLLVIGVDGVLTDAGMYFNERGDMMRKFNRRDGMGVQLLKSIRVKSAIVSSQENEIAKRWAEAFGVDFICLGAPKKLHEVEKLQIRCGLKPDQVGYISDDIDELDIMRYVGFGVTVADGADTNKRQSTYVTSLWGGQGAVREVVEIIYYAKQAVGG